MSSKRKEESNDKLSICEAGKDGGKRGLSKKVNREKREDIDGGTGVRVYGVVWRKRSGSKVPSEGNERGSSESE